MNLSDEEIDEFQEIYIHQEILNMTELHSYIKKKKKQLKPLELNLNEEIFKNDSNCPNWKQAKRRKYC